MSSSPPAESPQDRARVPRTAAPGVAAAGRTRYASGGRFTAEAAAVAARHGAAGERALPRPHPLLRWQPGLRESTQPFPSESLYIVSLRGSCEDPQAKGVRIPLNPLPGVDSDTPVELRRQPGTWDNRLIEKRQKVLTESGADPPAKHHSWAPSRCSSNSVHS